MEKEKQTSNETEDKLEDQFSAPKSKLSLCCKNRPMYLPTFKCVDIFLHLFFTLYSSILIQLTPSRYKNYFRDLFNTVRYVLYSSCPTCFHLQLRK